MSGGARAEEWTRRLRAVGAVDFGRSWGRVAVHAFLLLAFIVGGVGMVVAEDDAGANVLGVFVVAVFAFGLFLLVVQVTAPGPALRVDRRGVTLGFRRPLTIPWEQVTGVWVYKVNRIASATVAIDTSGQTLDEYARQASPLVRLLMGVRRIGPMHNTVMTGLVAAPAGELAAWLDSQVDVYAEVPNELILFPVEETSPVWGARSLRPVEVSRLSISPTLSEAITDWGRRAAPFAGRLLDGDEPAAAWASLAQEGRGLGVHLEQELSSGAVVHWFEDGPEGKRPST
jgi:hypothetical protein